MRVLGIILGLVFSPPAFAQGGDIVNNGGGLAESNLVYAFRTLPKLLERAEAHALFRDAPYSQMLASLKDPAREQAAHIVRLTIGENDVVFAGRRFFLEGEKIFVNVKALYLVGNDGGAKPFDVAKAYALAGEILSHRLPSRDEALWLEFSVRLERAARVRSETLYPSEAGSSCRTMLTILSHPVTFETTSVLLTDTEKAYDFADAFAEKLRCPGGRRAEAFSFRQARRDGFNLEGMRWQGSMKCGGRWSQVFETGLGIPFFACNLTTHEIDLEKVFIYDPQRSPR